MNLSAPFIQRPVATTLLTLGVTLAGAVAFFNLPVSPLPQIDFPTISVSASMAGASPDTMAATVATPLERHLGAIADVSEMTSQSSLGSTRITLQFGLDRDIDGAARDVSAAINAARVDLPAALHSNPSYRKVNPSDAPIMIVALTSDRMTRGQIYDAASSVLEQRLSQIKGVGEVDVNGASLPAVRVELNPTTLFKYGIGLEDVRAALSAANAHSPKGAIESGARHWQLYTNDQATTAAQFKDLLVAYRNGRPVRLTDVGDVIDSVENVRNEGLFNGKPAILVTVTKQPGANVIETIDRIRAEMPQLQAALPSAIQVTIARDGSKSIRASLHEVEASLIISVMLVILVVFLFLRSPRASMIPLVAVPVSLIGTFGIMLLCGFSLDNLSLMALTIATGFVVDDAVVVLENVSRHIERGLSPMEAAMLGAREVGFTVLSMSISLVAVFLPILLMGGLTGRLFREFAIVLSVAVMVSLAISLTTTPMMCSRLLRRASHEKPGRIFRFTENAFERLLHGYERSLAWALRNSLLMMVILLVTVSLNVWLYIILPKGLFPQQDNGNMMGNVQGDQSISFQLMQQKLHDFARIVQQDPAVVAVAAFTGTRATNSASMFVELKPKSQRKESIDDVVNRLRPKTLQVPGASVYFTPQQDIRVGGRSSNSTYQYTLQADDVDLLRQWTPKITEALKNEPSMTDVNSDQQDGGLETDIQIDRVSASRLNLTASQIDNTLYDAFGQRTVSTIYTAMNQYFVVMEVAPKFLQSPETLNDLWVSASGGTATGTQSTNALSTTIGTTAAANAGASASASAASTSINVVENAKNVSTGNTANASTGSAVSTATENTIPLTAFTSFSPGRTALSVNHQGQFVASTISFNLATNGTLDEAGAAIRATMADLHVPTSIHGGFAGTALTAQQSSSNTLVLILAALVAVYVVLGILYESYMHPLTILSTLPSAGVGALLALMICGQTFTLIALIGVILLIGIVKKNAIMMIDFALDAERNRGLEPHAAIYEACVLRFRPIMMTTMAALLGALPLAIGMGDGAELRRPLGISIVGGLIVSQALTLYTTPVIYLYIDRFRLWSRRSWGQRFLRGSGGPVAGTSS